MKKRASLRRRLAAAEAVLAIQNLKAQYAELVDQRLQRGAVVAAAELDRIAAEIADLFTPDGTWDGGPALGVAVGREAIAARLREPTLTFSRHLFVQPRITVAPSGKTAIGRWDLLSPCSRDGAGGKTASYLMLGHEDDEYVRRDGVWLHQSMRLTVTTMAPVSDGWGRILT